MGIITFDLAGCGSTVNSAAVAILECSVTDIVGKKLSGLGHPLAEVMAQMPKGDVRMVRMSDGRIYRCSMLSYMDCGREHPFMLVESLTDEVMAAAKRAYGNVIRMIVHEVNNTMGGGG